MSSLDGRRSVFILGAGFAKDAGMPLASELMGLVSERLSVATEPDIVQTRGQFFEEWTQRDPERRLSFDELARALLADRSAALRTLRLGCLKLFWDRSRQEMPEGYRAFARMAAHSEGVILWNWDITVERAAAEARVRWTYDAAQGGPCIRIVKLHGSLNWVCTPGARPLAERAWLEPYPEVFYLRESPLAEPDPRLILEATPMILPGEAQFLEPLWHAAESMLMRADRLVFIGCGFPDYDSESVQRILASTRASIFEVVDSGPSAQAKLEAILGRRVEGQSDGFLRSSYAAPSA